MVDKEVQLQEQKKIQISGNVTKMGIQEKY